MATWFKTFDECRWNAAQKVYRGGVVYVAKECRSESGANWREFAAASAINPRDVGEFGDILHEVIVGKVPHRLFFDFDAATDFDTEAEFLNNSYTTVDIGGANGPEEITQMGALCWAISVIASDLFSLMPCDVRIFVMSCCRLGKLSFHLTTNLIGTHQDNRKLAEDVYRFLKNRGYGELMDGIDMKVYSKQHNLRMIGSEKFGAPGSVKRVAEFGDATDMEYVTVWDDEVIEVEGMLTHAEAVPVDIPKDLEERWKVVASNPIIAGFLADREPTISGNIVNFSGGSGEMCPICERVHESVSTFWPYVLFGNSVAFLRCSRNDGDRKLGAKMKSIMLRGVDADDNSAKFARELAKELEDEADVQKPKLGRPPKTLDAPPPFMLESDDDAGDAEEFSLDAAPVDPGGIGAFPLNLTQIPYLPGKRDINAANERHRLKCLNAKAAKEAQKTKNRIPRWLGDQQRYLRWPYSLNKKIPAEATNFMTSKYLELSPEVMEAKFISILSPKGTGKTHAMLKMLEDHPEFKNVLFVTFRVTLGVDIVARSKDAGFEFYQDIKGAIDEKHPRVVCQLESLGRVTWKNIDLLIIDEAESLTKQLFSTTVTKKNSGSGLTQIFSNLTYFARASEKMVIMDADLTRDTILNFIEMAGLLKHDTDEENVKRMNHDVVGLSFAKKYIHIHNDHNEYNEKLTVNITVDMTTAHAALKKDILDGKRVVIPHSYSTRWGDGMKRWLLGLNSALKIEIYDKKTLSNKDSKESQGLKDVKTTWKGLDVVIYSPSIQAGVNFDVPDHFHCVHAFFTSSPGVNAQRQMLQRCRGFIDNRINVHLRKIGGKNLATTRYGILRQLRIQRAIKFKDIPAPIIYRRTENGYEYEGDKSLFNFYISDLLTKSLDDHMFYYRFIQHEVIAGCKVIYTAAPDCKKHKSTGDEEFIETIIEIKEEEVQSIYEAKDLTDVQADEVATLERNRCAISENLYYGMIRYRLRKKFRLSAKPISKAFIGRMTDRKKQEVFANWCDLYYDTDGPLNLTEALSRMREHDAKNLAKLIDCTKAEASANDIGLKLRYKKAASIIKLTDSLGFNINPEFKGSNQNEISADVCTEEWETLKEMVQLWPSEISKDTQKREFLKFLNARLSAYGCNIAPIKPKSKIYALTHNCVDVIFSPGKERTAKGEIVWPSLRRPNPLKKLVMSMR